MTWKGGHLDRKRARKGSEHLLLQSTQHSIYTRVGDGILQQAVYTTVVQGWGRPQANHLPTWCVVGAGQCMAWQGNKKGVH